MHSKFTWIKNFLTFSRGERNGIVLLIFFIIVLILAPFFYSSYNTPTPYDNSLFNAKVDSFFSSLKAKPNESISWQANPIESEETRQDKEINYFFFDPNNVQVDEMVQLGLSVKQAIVVEKYRNRGGVFRVPNDFAKVYVIDSFIYKKLKPWIKINPLYPHSKPLIKFDSIKESDNRSTMVELNTTDTLELIKIKGIGRAFARRIIAYRSLLGGYANIQQLSEVYGIKPELIKEISNFITIDSSRIKTINLNLVTYEELKKQPYLSDYQAKAIIYYRSKVGTMKNLRELVDNKILSNDKFLILKSYLVVY